MMEFPTLVYKDGGPHQRPGGTFDYKRIVNEDQLTDALADGWFLTLVEATQPAAADLAEVAPNDDAPPTREELETKARELGIKFDGRTSDKTLLSKIEAALAGA